MYKIIYTLRKKYPNIDPGQQMFTFFLDKNMNNMILK